ncbi:transglutaminase domain-containing protein [Paenibacillus senegalimassiliensis]|uniref:transglutaminase domain-containing protein n=1 Tax=Paenibacillus senegalimassiliensis TaxID=1737426 RepID=UPI00073EA6A5|nr:transglutaminase domain-containing protein [Paenibacillus senegalimassiliensis]
MGRRRGFSKRWVVTGAICVLLLGSEPLGWAIIPVNAAEDVATFTTVEQMKSKLSEGLKARQTTITFRYKGVTQELDSKLISAVEGALNADPYTKYIVDRYSYSWRGTSSSAKITLKIEYRETAEQTAYVQQRVKQILQKIIQPGMDTHQKIKVIHDFVVLNLKYDTDLQKYTAYEGLRTGEAVCQGYALLTYQLLRNAGVDSRVVEGTADGQLHAWNMAKVDGHWYHLDTTWDDPVPDVAGQVNYTYYLRTDKQMSKDHIWAINNYPRTTGTYREALDALANQGGAKQEAYVDLKKQLGYNLYDDDAAVVNASGLAGRVQEELKANSKKAVVRYAGPEDQLLDDLAALYELGLMDISYLAQPLEGTWDLRVEIYWE